MARPGRNQMKFILGNLLCHYMCEQKQNKKDETPTHYGYCSVDIKKDGRVTCYKNDLQQNSPIVGQN